MLAVCVTLKREREVLYRRRDVVFGVVVVVVVGFSSTCWLYGGCLTAVAFAAAAGPLRCLTAAVAAVAELTVG